MPGGHKVRDTRKRVFVVDDEYMNGYATICGPLVTAVYVDLCRHANKEQECWPSMRTMADRLGMSTKSVQRAIDTLESFSIITIERERESSGKMAVNVYTLLDKSEWKPKPEDSRTSGPEDSGSKNQRTVGKRKDTQLKDTHTASGDAALKTSLATTAASAEPPRQPSNVAFLVTAFFNEKGWEVKNGPAFRRHLRDAKGVLDEAGGSLEKAVGWMRATARWADAKSLDWTLGTVLKRIPSLNSPNQGYDERLFVPR